MSAAAATSTRVSLYGPNMQAMGRRFRQLSTHTKTGSYVVVGTKAANSSDRFAAARVDPDVVMNTLQFPMPGSVNAHNQFVTNETQSEPMELPRNASRSVRRSELLSGPLNMRQQFGALNQFNKVSWSEADTNLAAAVAEQSKESLHCIAIEAPKLVRKEFNDLFPNRDLSKGHCTIVSFVQKTENDMTAWNTKMEAERDALTAQFIDMASLICDALKKQGYWADFIDPSSGRPYLGAFTNDALLETDNRYRHMGVRIEDLGCCKVVRHERWGTRSFVSSLFTNAPTNSEHIQLLLAQFTK